MSWARGIDHPRSGYGVENRLHLSGVSPPSQVDDAYRRLSIKGDHVLLDPMPDPVVAEDLCDLVQLSLGYHDVRPGRPVRRIAERLSGCRVFHCFPPRSLWLAL